MRSKHGLIKRIALCILILLMVSACKKNKDESVSSGTNYTKIVYLGSTNLSQARCESAGSSYGNKILFAGGTSGNGVCFTTVDVYDISTGTWTVSQLSQGRSDLVSASAGNKVFFGGGFTDNSVLSKVVDIYDATTGAWTVAELSQA